MTDLWNYLKNTDKPIVLYGTGNGGDKIIDKMIAEGIDGKIAGIFASSGFVRDRYFRGYKVESYEMCKERLGDMIVLVCFGTGREDVLANIYRIADECELYAPDVPVYGDNVFDEEFYNAHLDEIAKVQDMLEDNVSKLTYKNTILNKLTGDIKYLRECEVTADEADSLLGEATSFLDLGAYNGDTVLRYTKMFPTISTIYAVEPDSRNFRKLMKNTEAISGIECINSIISDYTGLAEVDGDKGRGVHEKSITTGSAIDQSDIRQISAITIDDILGGKKVDFIKFDVEGNELKALNGGANTIKNHKPQMLVSCYHRSEDIFTLPLRIKELCPDYKVYMRHLPHVPGWDTAFYFV